MTPAHVAAVLAALMVVAGCVIFGGTSQAAAPETMFGTTKPKVTADTDSAKVELGVQFKAAVAGQVTGVRFYMGTGNTGTHTGSLWTGSTRTRTGTFTGGTATGWQTLTFTTPLTIKAGTVYTASYLAPRGRYSVDNPYTFPKVTGNLTAIKGTYRYGGGYPNQTYQASNYWVDVNFAPVSAPPTTSTTTAASTTPVSTTPTTAVSSTPESTINPTSTTTTPQSGGTVVLGRSFPDASTTGVPAGTVLTPYTGSCTITDADVTIDRKVITCDQLRLLGPNATITNSIINGTVYSDCCYLNGSYTLTDSEVIGPQSSGTVVGEARFTLTRVEVTGGSRSVFCNIACTVQDSYLHGQYTDLRGIDHESAIRMDNSLVLQHTQIACDATPVPPDAGCSAALTGYGDFGTVQNNLIDNNLIDGGPAGSVGYCSYGGSTQGKPYPNAHDIRFTNNIFRRGPSGICGIWGPITSFDSNAPGNVWTNNLYDDGTPVPPAN